MCSCRGGGGHDGLLDGENDRLRVALKCTLPQETILVVTVEKTRSLRDVILVREGLGRTGVVDIPE